MKDIILNIDTFCRKHEDVASIIGGIISLVILKMAGAF